MSTRRLSCWGAWSGGAGSKYVAGGAPVPEGKPAAVDRAPRRRRRKKTGLIEIELEGGRRIRVDRDVDAAALERVLDVLARR